MKNLRRSVKKKKPSCKEAGAYLFGAQQVSESDLPGAGTLGWMSRSGPEVGNPGKARP